MADINNIWPGWHAEELLGQGSYGKVYRISRSEFGHTSYAAAKLIEIPQGESEVSSLIAMGMDGLSIRSYFEDTARNIINEISVMESLKGARNVVAIEDYRLVEHEDGIGWTICIRMELLQTLSDYQKIHGAPDVEETVKIGIDICNALMCCEQRGIVHRDVKPENIFRSEFGEYKLGDFGIARQIENSTRSAYSQKGTGPYMAPEVVRGQKYGSSVDVYSLGIMLYRYLNDMRFPFLPPAPQPFTASDVEQANFRRLRGDSIPALHGIDVTLSRAVCKACAADARWRYASAAEFRDALIACGNASLPSHDLERECAPSLSSLESGMARGRNRAPLGFEASGGVTWEAEESDPALEETVLLGVIADEDSGDDETDFQSGDNPPNPPRINPIVAIAILPCIAALIVAVLVILGVGGLGRSVCSVECYDVTTKASIKAAEDVSGDGGSSITVPVPAVDGYDFVYGQVDHGAKHENAEPLTVVLPQDGATVHARFYYRLGNDASFAGSWTLVEMEEDGTVTAEEDLETLSDMGVTVSIVLNDDHTLTFNLFGETLSGTWKADSATMGEVEMEDQRLSMRIDGDKLNISQDGASLTFVRSSSGGTDAK